jgi:acetyl esterase/lipase
MKMTSVLKPVLLVIFFMFTVNFTKASLPFDVYLQPDSSSFVRVLLPADADRPAKAVVICPGGGYSRLAMSHEGYDWAPFFNDLGIAAIVLKYRMPSSNPSLPINDALDALRLAGTHAVEWNIDPSDIGIMGFSAGGHLASTIATHAPQELRPAFQILFYPVITMNPEETHAGSRLHLLGENPTPEQERLYNNEYQVDDFTPAAFIALSHDDTVVHPINSISYYNALLSNNIPATMHIYPDGGHGWGIRSEFSYHKEMLTELARWLSASPVVTLPPDSLYFNKLPPVRSEQQTPVSAREDIFPDGTPVPDWFHQTELPPVDNLGKRFLITDHGVTSDSTMVQTKTIQSLIDRVSQSGGGVIVIPRGTFLSGSLFFKTRTHLHIEAGGVLKGSDDISDFPLVMTRIEGQTLKYFAALINADHLDGFTISGQGTVNGNGLRYWKAFWMRRAFNPRCTNMDEMRPRLVYISNSKDVNISGIHLKDSPFWTTHLYKCERVKLLGLSITSPASPVKAPSTDAIDIDACHDVLIKNCYMSVNDDAIALKGGKGPFADRSEDNGDNRNIIIEDCTYGFCHSALTCGSESIRNRNIIFRRSVVNDARRILWLKMRPDTPQHYEHMLIENISGKAGSMIYIKPWTQFFDLQGEPSIKRSLANHVTMRNINLQCDIVFDIDRSDQYQLSNFSFENITINAVAQPDRKIEEQ